MEAFGQGMPSDWSGYLSCFGENHTWSRIESGTAVPVLDGDRTQSQVQNPHSAQKARLIVDTCTSLPCQEGCSVQLEHKEQICTSKRRKRRKKKRTHFLNQERSTGPKGDSNHHGVHQERVWHTEELQGSQNEGTFPFHDVCLLSHAYGIQQCYISLYRNLDDMYKGKGNVGYISGVSGAPVQHQQCRKNSMANSRCGLMENQIASQMQQHSSCSTGSYYLENNPEDPSRTSNTRPPSMSDVQTNGSDPLNASDPRPYALGDDSHFTSSTWTSSHHFESLNVPVEGSCCSFQSTLSGQYMDEAHISKFLQGSIKPLGRSFLAHAQKDHLSLMNCDASTSLCCVTSQSSAQQTVTCPSKPTVQSINKTKEKNCTPLTFEEAIEMFDLSLLEEESAETGFSANLIEGQLRFQDPSPTTELSYHQ